MESASARTANERPFYASMGEHYDLLVAAPVEPWVNAIRELRSTGSLLDAGCGTGRQADALAEAGYDVEMTDASAVMLARAEERNPHLPAHQQDICTMDLGKEFDIVACRGVLNDLLSDLDRRAALESLARHVAVDGYLCLDVREQRTASQRVGVLQRKKVRTSNGELLSFVSHGEWDHPFLVVDETHTLTAPRHQARVERYEFRMRPWTTAELREGLADAGMIDVEIGPAVGRATNDRLFVTARRGAPAR